MGGLGNQMFQYAFAYNLALKNNTVLKVDITLLRDKSQPHEIVTHRDLLLDTIFDLKITFATQEEVNYFNGKKYNSLIGKIYNKIAWQFKKHRLIIEEDRKFNAKLLKLGKDICLVGSYQCEQYFSENSTTIKSLYKFRQAILPQTAALSRRMESSNSVAVHVRRGDYVSSPLYSKMIGALAIEYYDGAVELIQKNIVNPEFFVFSDDISWCRAAFGKYQLPFTYVDYKHDASTAANDLQLMTLNKHFIISNSSYAWWGAWLGESKNSIVIGPNKWFNDQSINGTDIVPKIWIKI
jgi:hypothetical protein